MERYLGTVTGHLGDYAVYVDGNRAIVRGHGIEWDHSIAAYRYASASKHPTKLARQVANLLNIEFGPDS